MEFINIIALVCGLLGGVFCITVGYQIGVKYNYKVVSHTFNYEEYPTEIKNKYCRYVGLPFIIMGLIILMMSVMYKNDTYMTTLKIATVVVIIYEFLVPKYILKKS